MSDAGIAQVTLVPNQGWDPRILVCGYELVYGAYALPMHVFIVVSERYVVLVDTLVNEATAQALLELARPHLHGRGLLVVNTHADYDHAWGNQLFAAPTVWRRRPIIGTRDAPTDAIERRTASSFCGCNGSSRTSMTACVCARRTSCSTRR